MTYAPYVNMQPHPFPPAVPPPPMPTAPYSDISPYASHHQPSQVMGSLPSSARSEDQYPFHGRQYHDQTQLVYKQPTPPFDVSSPHPDLPAPLSPPLLVPATSSYHDLNAFTSEPEHRIIDRPMPPRRRTRDSSRHRISPPYARPPNHRSGGSRGAPSLPSPHATWSQPGPAVMPPNGEPFVMVNNAAVAASRAVATIRPAPVIITPTAAAASSHGKRNPEKKPALACVFCRGRKIACGPPPKDGDGKTCKKPTRHAQKALISRLSINSSGWIFQGKQEYWRHLEPQVKVKSRGSFQIGNEQEALIARAFLFPSSR
ncbi:hypothetical protein NP233_g9017 [Leucocoprinus birnbaumii]|uniref:Uncharacterized protein n=1 Tax=Leucocoprinus birnbaumii TaxID=56174 RepID=A0AAD5VL50_9AGAR|nr:hypothetical protein NP233_g9017 [Leucocoprinus birnbaumii]